MVVDKVWIVAEKSSTLVQKMISESHPPKEGQVLDLQVAHLLDASVLEVDNEVSHLDLLGHH